MSSFDEFAIMPTIFRSALYLILATVLATGCTRRVPPVATTQPPPGQGGDAGSTASKAPPAPTRPPAPPAPPARAGDDGATRQPALPPDGAIDSRSLDDLNRNSPLRPVFFALDSAELDDAGRQTSAANADVLRRFPSWVITIEGHCDDRGTSEYNLALGERRAAAVRAYLESLGIAAARLRTVSYGEEFPFDSTATEEAWSQNRRAHFVITSK